MKKYSKYSEHTPKEQAITHGFTIIEVIIVVVVIGILASVVAIAGGGYIKRSNEAAVKSNLVTAAAAMKQEYNQEGSYPIELPASLDASADTLTLNGGGAGYCIEGVKGSATFYITQNTATPQQRGCPGGSGPGPEEPPAPGPNSYTEAVTEADGGTGPSSNCLFNESGSAYVNFSCMGGLNGQLQPNAPTFTTQQPGAIVSNPSNSAIGFNGNNHYSYGNPGTSTNNQGNNWTAMVWAKPNQSASTQAIISADDNWALRFNGGNGFTCAMRTGNPWGVSSVSGGPSSVAGTWYHVACTYESGTLRLYVNGQLVGTTNNVPIGQSGNGNFRPGYVNSGWTSGGYLNGYIDEFAFYKSTLDASTISNLYTQAGY